jgi:hypothetical protein
VVIQVTNAESDGKYREKIRCIFIKRHGFPIDSFSVNYIRLVI